MGIGYGQLLIILVLILVIFGAGRLPRIMSDLAKGMRAFKKGITEDEQNDTANIPSTLLHMNEKQKDHLIEEISASVNRHINDVQPVKKIITNTKNPSKKKLPVKQEGTKVAHKIINKSVKKLGIASKTGKKKTPLKKSEDVTKK